MNKFRTIIIAALIYFGLSFSTILLAQSSDTTLLPSRGEHIFTSITGVEDPFISTKFMLNVGSANLFNTEIPITIPMKDNTVNFQPQLFYVIGGIAFQKSVNDWAAIHLNLGATARVGNNVVSIATQGISAANFFGIGLLFRLAENKNLFLSGSIDLNKSSLTYISLQGKFEDIVSDTSANQEVFNQFQILTGDLQFRFAYNFSRVIGIMANCSGSFGEIYARNSNSELNWSFGALLSVDLRNWINIPFGIGFGGTILSNDWEFSETKNPIYTANLNISFINQHDLSISWENYVQMFEQDQFDQIYYFHYSRLYLRYYF